MGSQQSHEARSTSQWEWVQNQNGVEIYRNKQDGRLAERRRIALTGNYTLSEQNKVYNFRSSNCYGLVKSYEVIQIHDPTKQKERISDLCKCANQKIQLDVFTERISYRLSQLPQLTFLESLQILRQTATAFEVAYQKVGGLHINHELIGITDKGEVRAWVNQNWALNHPSHIIPILKSSSNKESFDAIIPQLRDETEMINNLISVISEKTEQGHFPSPFIEQLKAKANNFRSVRKFINEYVAANKISLPAIIKKNKLTINTPIQSPFPKLNQPIKSNSLNTIPQPQFQQSFQPPKFSFNNASYQQNNVSNPLSIHHESRFIYKPSSIFVPQNTQPTLAQSNFIPQPSLSQRPDIKQTVSNYKYLSESKEREAFKPIFNELKFSLLPHLQSVSQPVELKNQPINTLDSSKPESPFLGLNQLVQNEIQTTHHNASYKIIGERDHSIQA